MALIKCSDCGTAVSTKAASCPKCGRVLRRAPQNIGCCGSIVLLGLVGFCGLVALTVLSEPQPQPQGERVAPSPPAPAPGPPATPDTSGGKITLTREDFGGYWPLEADEILLVCEPTTGPLSGSPAHHVLAVVDGKTYAVNGTAKTRADQRGWADFDSLITEAREPSGAFSAEATEFRKALVDKGLALSK